MRAAIYCRVSGAKQEKNSSLDTQEAACRAYAAAQEWKVQEAHIYREVFSGAYLDRPKLDRLRDAIDRREVDRVIVWHSDRFRRDPNERIYLRVDAKRSGVLYESVTGPVDVTPEGSLPDFVAGYVAYKERAAIIRRTVEGRVARVRSGKRLVRCKPRTRASTACSNRVGSGATASAARSWAGGSPQNRWGKR